MFNEIEMEFMKGLWVLGVILSISYRWWYDLHCRK